MYRMTDEEFEVAVAEALDAHRTETFPFTRDGEVAATARYEELVASAKRVQA